MRLIKTGTGNALCYRIEDVSPVELATLQLALALAGYPNIGPACEERTEFRSWSRSHLTLHVTKVSEHGPWEAAPPPDDAG
jgi:hypothetical protein